MTENLISSENITVLQVVDTIYTADSVEWCPNEPNQNIFVCSNYQLKNETELESASNKRFGKIRLYSLDKSNQLTLHQIIDNDGVLDQKWCHNKIKGHSILGVVNAKNTLEIYKFNEVLIQLELITKIINEDDEILMLSLDWSTGKYFSVEPEIVASDSKGNISIFKFKNDEICLKSHWKAHDFEAWISAFYYWDVNVIFTGGDDSKLLKYDFRVSNSRPIFKCNEYTSGVTSIHSNKEKEFILATGSYDSNLHIWDIRNMKSFLSNILMPDSVWRLKWNPNDFNYLLAACMRKGFHILKINDENVLKNVSSYYEHKDIAYGCDWKYNEKNNFIIGACSFYDHKLSVASAKLQ